MSILTLLRKMPILLVVPIERGYKNEDFATIQYYFISLLFRRRLKNASATAHTCKCVWTDANASGALYWDFKSRKDAAVFLIEIMPVMFIPAAVGLLESWDALRPVVVPVLMITVITTVIVIAVTGVVTQIMIRKRRKKDENSHLSGQL